MIRISKEILKKGKPDVFSQEGLKEDYFRTFGYSFDEVHRYEEVKYFFKYEGDLNSYFSLWVLGCYSITGKKEATNDEILTETFVYFKFYQLKNDSGIVMPRNGIPCDYGSINRANDPVIIPIYNKPDLKFRKMKLVGHYTNMETVLEKILPENSLLINTFKDTNDPWEYRENCNEIFDFSKIYPDPLDRTINTPVLQALFLKSVRFFSLTQDTNLVKCFDHPGMWAHYGQNHEGICLIFDLVKLKKKFKTQFNTKWGSIKYGKIESKPIIIEDVFDPENAFNKYAEKIFYKKLRDWKNEEEFRFVIYDSAENCQDNMYLKNIDRALIAIILGAHFNKVYKCVLENHLSKRDHKNKIELYQLVFNNGYFSIKDINGNEETHPCKNMLNGYIIENH